MRFSKKDLLFTTTTGMITGLIFWRILSFLKAPEFYSFSYVWLIILVPLAWIFGVNLGYFLGRWLAFFNQFGRFAVIGFNNAAIDFGTLNLEIFFFGINSGPFYSVFKIVSFLTALINSYFSNKYWTFEAAHSGGGRAEFLKFAGVASVSVVINVSVASAVVNLIHPLFGLSGNAWANIGAVIGSAVALIFSFIGFRVAVFKKANS